MEIIVNGENRQLAGVRTLVQVLGELNLTDQDGGIAVALNDEVVPKSKWNTTRLSPGDRIEVIHAVQGG